MPGMWQIIKHFFVIIPYLAALCAGAAAAKGPALVSEASAWVVVDGLSDSVMVQSAANKAVNPGDLVQLMTLYTALELAKSDASPNRMNEEVSITPADSLRAQGSRRLYLVSGEPAPLRTLLNGIAVLAAEDAALAVARHLAGSLEAFVDRMNAFAKELGLKQSHFTAPIAAPGQTMSALDLAHVAIALHKRHSDEFAWFSSREFDFAGHTQRNRNLMLWKGRDVGGIMTNAKSTDIVSSWHREGGDKVLPRHVFAVLIGGKSGEAASNDMLTLLKTGRLEFETVKLFSAGVPIKSIDILTGNRDTLEVGSNREIWVTVRRKDIVSRGTGGFSAKFNYLAPAVAPVRMGDTVGTLSIFFENKHVADFELQAMHDVGMGSFLSRFVDSVRLRMKPAGDETTPQMLRPTPHSNASQHYFPG